MKVRGFDFTRVPRHDGTELVYAPVLRSARIEDTMVSRVLVHCASTATLEEHAGRVARRLGREVSGVDVLALLRRLAGDGYLLSHDEIAARLARRPPSGERTRLSRLVVPTRARPALLARAVTSFARNAADFGRPCAMLVVEDGTDADATARALGSIDRAGAAIVLFDRLVRGELSRRLAHATGVDREVVDFALGVRVADDAVTTGAARNAALLCCAGERFVSIDDDQVGRFVSTRDASRPAITVSSDVDPTEIAAYTERAHRWDRIDYLAAHDDALGHDAATLILEHRRPGDATFEQASAVLVRALVDDARTVVATTTGYAGDSGLASNATFLGLKGRSRARLLAGGDWGDLRGSREVLRAPTAAVLSDVGFVMGGGLGLDGRAFLPPFFPTGRNQDGSFAAVLRVCRPHDPTMWLPLAVLHDPERRPSTADPITGAARARRINDILILMAAGWSSPRPEADARARAFGAYLLDFGASSPGVLEEHLRLQTWRRTSARLEHLEHVAGDRSLPDGYRDDASRLAHALRDAVLDDPTVLEEAGARTVRDALGSYGRLLLAWSELLRAAPPIARELQAPA